MAEPQWTLDNFRRAGHGHLHGASRVLENAPARGAPEPALTPASAAYLAHVALECAMKARLLSRGGYGSARALAEKAPQVHAALFRSTRGHDLGALAGHLRLEKIVKMHGKTWSDDACWRRMASSYRPYSLRYGAEPIKRCSAEEEVQRASALLGLLLDGITTVALHRKRRERR